MISLQNSVLSRVGLLAFLICSIATSSLADVETWTSMSGTTVEAEFVEMRNGLAVFKTATGKELRISSSKLDQASRVRIETLVQQASEKAEEAKSGHGPRVFREINHPYYDAVLRIPNGQVLIYPKQKGSRMGDIIELNLQGRYSDGSVRESRIPISLIEDPKWENDHVVFKLLMTDDVVADLYYRFEPAKIEVGYTIDEPEGVVHTDDYRIQMSFGGILKYDEETETYSREQFPQPMSRSEVNEALKGDMVRINPIKGKKQTYTFTESIDDFPGPSKSIQILSAYRGMDLRIDSPSKGYIWARIYPGSELMDGFSVAYKKEKIETPADKSNELVTLKFGP